MVSVHNHRFLIASDVMLRVVKKAFPVVSVSLAVATLVISSSIAIRVHGSPWSNVTIRELRNHGGVANDQLARGEWWRLLTAVHTRQPMAHALQHYHAVSSCCCCRASNWPVRTGIHMVVKRRYRNVREYLFCTGTVRCWYRRIPGSDGRCGCMHRDHQAKV
jgi:hypothetical protein